MVALNAHLDPRKLTRDRNEFEYSLNQLCHIVTSLKYDIGCLIDAGGEKLFVVNERGETVDSDRLLTIVTAMFCETHPGVEGHCRAHHVLRRSGSGGRTSGEEGHEDAQQPSRDDGGGTDNTESASSAGRTGGFIFTDFFFATDAMYSVAKILEMMAHHRKAPGRIRRQPIPRLAPPGGT